jgi:hypothetical protein
MESGFSDVAVEKLEGVCNEKIYKSMQTVTTNYRKLHNIKMRFTGEEFEYKRWSDV